MKAAELDDFDYHKAAWAKFERRFDELSAGGFVERIRNIPPRQRLLRSIEWGAYLAGRDWQIFHAREPKQRRRKWCRNPPSGIGTSIW